ncbi:MAG TPA: polysaccharide deacetylase family protein [Thermoanaerobaculia bacterium]|nr:polysaccharide deacetylase family protein [Thermoanaerobaculia bacterium]
MTPLTVAAAFAGTSALAFSLRFHWWRPRRGGVPVLMYHQIAPHRAGSALNAWRLPPEEFERQLDHLVRRGLAGVTLRDLLDVPPRPGDRRVVLTFDDGYDGVRTAALPLLRARGFSATVFVVSGKLGGANDWDGETPGDALLSEEGLRELAAAGLEIGSHGATHRALPELPDAELAAETRGSREVLERIVGLPVVSFCYPFGAASPRAAAAVREAGFRAATVIRGGLVPDLDDPFRLRRVAVRGTRGLLDFRLALTRGRSTF